MFPKTVKKKEQKLELLLFSNCGHHEKMCARKAKALFFIYLFIFCDNEQRHSFIMLKAFQLY